MEKIRVGFIGVEANRSWAAFAHLPALKELQDKYEVVGVANRSFASAQKAAAACGIPKAYESVDALVADPTIDMVVVTVRVPAHKEVLQKAIKAGKIIYCEWPLAVDWDEARELVALAKEYHTQAFIGMQARRSPSILELQKIVGSGKLGRILSHSIVAYGRIGQAEINDNRTEQYLLDRKSGATMLTISVGHTLSALQFVFGKVTDLNSLLAVQRPQVYSHDSHTFVQQTAADQVILGGKLDDDSVFSLHFRGGMPLDGKGFLWIIEGEKGVIKVTALSGAIQVEDLQLEICMQDEGEAQEVQANGLSGENTGIAAFRNITPASGLCGENFVAGNVARMYESTYADIVNGTHNTPDFDDAIELHELMERIKAQ